MLRTTFRLNGDAVVVTSSVRADLRRWLTALEEREPDGVPLASVNGVRPASDGGAVYADASGSIGWAAWTAVGRRVLYVDGEWSDGEIDVNIADELYASAASRRLPARGLVGGTLHGQHRGPCSYASVHVKHADVQLLEQRVDWSRPPAV